MSTHVLDATNGTHAAGLRIELSRVAEGGKRNLLLSEVTDSSGRISADVPATESDAGMTCELSFQLGEYFECGTLPNGERILREAALRFIMSDPQRAYHIPVIIAPSGCSIWCSR
ncbi:MAG: hydroxyisourate hydrolase [Alphaproteobacteria bacterium]|nr:hydroxyisourate hydrolase [Alphaproteobacteria bacterium]MDA8030344.1 hydroxyisourate hydrolase [Alphaproteobacteria bacterium]